MQQQLIKDMQIERERERMKHEKSEDEDEEEEDTIEEDNIPKNIWILKPGENTN